MARKVTHRQIYKPAFGGIANTTVCGRVRNDTDYNVAEDHEAPTCTYCLRAIAAGTYGTKWIGWKEGDPRR